jgi:GH15 family glucan-1,4-alpha-glucosidase
MFKPLSEYGIIGNCRSIALVSDEGSVDFACLPNFDSAAYFCSILDDEIGGFFKIAPQGFFQTNQKYKPDTNILKTYFFNQNGSVSLTDFMPILRSQEESNSIPEYGIKIVRKITALKGDHKIDLVLKVTPDFAKEKAEIKKEGQSLILSCQETKLVLFGEIKKFKVDNNILTLTFDLKEGEEQFFGLGFYPSFAEYPEYTESHFKYLYKETELFWKEWISQCVYEGQYKDQVTRSALVLKLLTFNPTGAIVAAPTTSLPEKLGGDFNWDYRFTWLRDASFTVHAFLGLGFIKEAAEFMSWLERTCVKEGNGLKIMYGIHGEEELPEAELKHLKGYMNSAPVRTGNGAANQKQFDVYGEVLSAIEQFVEAGGVLSVPMQSFVRKLVDYCCTHWKEKDDGVWESRNGPEHNVFSKVMCWVGINCGLRIFEKLKIKNDFRYWKTTEDLIKEDVIKNGYNEKIQSFSAYYGSTAIDTSTLNIPLVGFLPANDQRVLSTLDQVMRNLVIDWFVVRTADEKDTLKAGEGTFFLSTFWLIDCLTMLGRFDEAKVWLDRIIHDATPLGLYAEEFDPHSKQHLGNFPQAYTHLGLINTVLSLEQAQGLNIKQKKQLNKEGIFRFFEEYNVKRFRNLASVFSLVPLLKT